jgi:hypothetical protein
MLGLMLPISLQRFAQFAKGRIRRGGHAREREMPHLCRHTNWKEAGFRRSLLGSKKSSVISKIDISYVLAAMASIGKTNGQLLRDTSPVRATVPPRK